MAIHGIFSYNSGSEGAKNLARGLGVKLIKHENSKFLGRAGKVVINWGSSRLPENVQRGGTMIINPPNAVAVASNKAEAFRAMKNAKVPIPEYTGELQRAQQWLAEGHIVFARTKLQAHSGEGIVEMLPDHPDTHNVNAPLYVKYISKKYEYRIHVFRGEVLDRQRKGLAEEWKGRDDINWHVRNLANGFIYVRNDGHQVPEVVDQAAVAAVRAIGLDFGAVDIIYNEKQKAAYVLEVNTAPGIMNATVDSYVRAFNNI